MTKKAVRAFYYLIWICTREARHNQSLAADLPKIGKQFGTSMQGLFTSIKGGEAAISQKFLDHPPQTTSAITARRSAGRSITASGRAVMAARSGASSPIAWCASSRASSPPMMLETIWTLSHNDGPIFNKGQFYGMYSSTLIRILDVQRSRQIPEAVLDDTAIAGFAATELKSIMQALPVAFPGKIGKWVDWYKVEALGSVHLNLPIIVVIK